MNFIEPECRHPTKEAIEKLANTFSLPNHSGMQDWEYEVADPNRILEFFSEYKNGKLTDDEKFTLLEVLLQSFEESEIELNESKTWLELLKLIQLNFRIHKYSIWYWSVYDAEADCEKWRITPFMREIYEKLA